MSLSGFLKIRSFFFENINTRQTIFKNTFWLFISQAVEAGAAFLIAIALARYFGPGVFGQWSFAFSFVSLFVVLADFSFGSFIIREISKDKSKTAQYMDNIIFMKLVLGALALLLIWVSIQFLEKNPQVLQLVYLLGLYIIIESFSSFFQSFFRANEKMQYETACRVLQSISRLGLVFFFILNNSKIISISYGYIISSVIGIIFSIIFIWYYFSKFFKKIDFALCKEILRESFPFALGALLAVGYLRAGTIILSLIKGDHEVGYYSAAFGLAYTLILIPNLFMISVFPVLSRLSKESTERMKEVYKKSLKYILILDIILLPMLFIFSSRIILGFYGDHYSSSILTFQILLIGQIFSFFGVVLIYTLAALNMQIVYTKIAGGMLLFNVIASLILIRIYAHNGLALAMALTEILGFALMLIFVERAFRLRTVNSM